MKKSSVDYKNNKNLTLINRLFLPEGIDNTMADCNAFDELMKVCFIHYYRHHFSKVKTVKYFNHVFQKLIHMSPGEYRKRLSRGN